MDKVLKEQGLSCSDLTAKQCQIEFGKILQVQKIVTGSISKAEETYFLTVWITDVESAKVEKIENTTCKNCSPEQLVQETEEMAGKLLGEITIPLELAVIELHSIPAGGKVKINGKPKGKTPLTGIQLEPGVYKVEVSMRGYHTYNTELNLAANSKENINTQLSPGKDKPEKTEEQKKKQKKILIGIGISVGVGGLVNALTSGGGGDGGGDKSTVIITW